MAEIEECVKCHRSRMGMKISFDEKGDAYVGDELGDFVCDECFRKYEEMRHATEADEKLSDSEKDAKRRAAAKELIH